MIKVLHTQKISNNIKNILLSQGKKKLMKYKKVNKKLKISS